MDGRLRDGLLGKNKTCLFVRCKKNDGGEFFEGKFFFFFKLNFWDILKCEY